MTMASEVGMPPSIASQLDYLLSHSSLSIKVEQMWSGSRYPPGLVDRFTLLIPYCLDYIKWDVIYNGEFPLVAPDVVFGPEDEHFWPYPDVGYGGEGELKPPKSSLLDWDGKDPARLMTLIEELRSLYASYQRKRVGEVDDDRVKFEISTIAKEGIEMLLNSCFEKPEEVKFAVPLMDRNINKMVPGCPWKHQQKIYLQVVYPVGRKYLSTPSPPRLKLVSSPDLKALFSVDDVKLPPWSDGMCMAEYLPHLEDTLERQISEAVSSIDTRRRFIEALALVLGRPIEADPYFCRKATLSCSTGVFIFLVYFDLPTQFPKLRPSIILQSTQHFKPLGTPLSSLPLRDYPWSPRWEASKMVERISEFLMEESLNFKKYCTDSQLQ